MKIKIFDIETTNLNADYGIILCACVMDYDTGRYKVFRADQYKSWKTKASDDSAIVRDIINELEDADILVAHNGQYFDKAFLNAKCSLHGIKNNLRTKKFIDPVLIARRHMRIGRNSLASLIGFFDIQEKKTAVSPKHWLQAALDKNTKSMDYIVHHCIQDIKALKLVYDKVKWLVDKINNSGSHA